MEDIKLEYDKHMNECIACKKGLPEACETRHKILLKLGGWKNDYDKKDLGGCRICDY